MYINGRDAVKLGTEPIVYTSVEANVSDSTQMADLTLEIKILVEL